MPYCSRPCLRADWPQHKIICGMALTHEMATTTVVVYYPHRLVKSRQPIDTSLPEYRPDRTCSIRSYADGYKRSPAFVRQAMLLQQNSSTDYFLSLKNNLVALQLQRDEDSGRFCAARDDVMSTGMVNNMESFRHLVACCCGYTEGELVAQLDEEYGVRLVFNWEPANEKRGAGTVDTEA
ncbi:hypothetical protein FB451DRAFT_1552895 [Mycena latifolia]|nr:hypothetical protein FB451DRAFT_1552895 [Mycena latifolia]